MNDKLHKYHEMSPFEIKDILIDLAQEYFKKNGKKEDKFLDAGRGNPNFFNTTIRDIFSYFTLFAVDIAHSRSSTKHIAYRYTQDLLYEKFISFAFEKI